jgi:uncharacterized protein
LLWGIRVYWRLVPPGRRRTCLFAESCSRYVYRIAAAEGSIAGMRALWNRRRTCRPGYAVLGARNVDGTRLVRLADGQVVGLSTLSTSAIERLSTAADRG